MRRVKFGLSRSSVAASATGAIETIASVRALAPRSSPKLCEIGLPIILQSLENDCVTSTLGEEEGRQDFNNMGRQDFKDIRTSQEPSNQNAEIYPVMSDAIFSSPTKLAIA